MRYLAILPIDDEGRFDERGNEYELGNEALQVLLVLEEQMI